MARKPRIEFPGAFYHVIARGNNRQRVFADDKDYKYFLERLSLYKERFKFILYAYVLMPNHIHMLLETGDAPLSRIMQALQSTYTQKFNRRHKKVGHLFQGRYKTILCQKENYLLELIRYIALNPVRAHLVDRPIDWEWSSYHDLIRQKGEHTVSFDDVVSLFGNRPDVAVKSLQKHVNASLKEGHNESYYKLKDQRILGEDGFAIDIVKTSEIMAGNFAYYNVKVGEIIKLVAKHMDITKEQIESVRRERIGAKARGIVAYIAKTLSGMTTKETSKYFKKSEAALSKLIKTVEQEMFENKTYKKLISQIEADIKNNYQPCLVRETKSNKLIS